MTDRTRRRPLRSAERAASILESAAHVFARAGYAATSMDEVAAEAGVSKLIVYRHFNSKRELYLAVLNRVGEHLQEALGTSPQEPLKSGDHAQAIAGAAAYALAMVSVARAWPDGFRLLFRQAAREPEFADQADQLSAQLAAGAERQLAQVPDQQFRRWTARLIAAVTIEGMLAWLDVGDPARDAEMADRLARVMGGIVGMQGWDLPLLRGDAEP